jgi:hypothetical protein
MLRNLALIGALAGTTILLGCSHEAAQQASVETTLPASFGFHYVDEGDYAKLAFGQANSDNVGLMLQCAKGSRQVEVSDVIRSAPAQTLTLTSGGQRSDVKVEVMPGPGASMAVGHAPLAAPALAGFRRSGAMEVSYAGLHYGMAAKPQEKPALERFFSACERRAA